MIQFTIPGEPQGKGRARAALRGGQPRLYTPDKTVAYEGLIAMAGQTAMRGRPPLAGQVQLQAVAYFPVPTSWSKKRREAALRGQERPGKKPDMDNIIKAIGDGGNGVTWIDDSQIVEIRAGKWYAATPRVEVVITEA